MEIKDYVFKQIKKLTKKSFDENSSIKDLNIDSLDLVVLISEVEEQLKITISDEELLNFKTISDIINTLETKLK
ncbi:acyl carrier protein [[Mycoplasma] anseris]|uniref:Acyl carrier protein n=1 Tax=[Mycoplasma] anseris TaxID=92400 RepID=A0A2Z4NCF3_9BACT|nr:acyl carrier protein [[Mycoplasma] anseris]AWX69239.1 acyl carrier protein [[Mycoplasma] anseris]